jgi:hypothetical protein
MLTNLSEVTESEMIKVREKIRKKLERSENWLTIRAIFTTGCHHTLSAKYPAFLSCILSSGVLSLRRGKNEKDMEDRRKEERKPLELIAFQVKY